MPDQKNPPSRTALASIRAGLLAAVTLAGPAAADQPAAGDWSGAGPIATEIGAQPRTARCRARVGTEQASDSASTTTFTIDGQCAVAAGSSAFTLTVALQGDGTVSAELLAPALSRPARFRGRREGDRIELASTAYFEKGGRRHRSSLVIAFKGDHSFSITEWQRPELGGEKRLSLSLDFERAP